MQICTAEDMACSDTSVTSTWHSSLNDDDITTASNHAGSQYNMQLQSVKHKTMHTSMVEHDAIITTTCSKVWGMTRQ